ncbi:fibronectin type III domain-containing protein [Tahibacter harae]|uniref:Beta-propeller fold lactonase family protein n=1 Tax=Tahibacter harae TaxID=2963937 RepID=A0ABT1QTB9_9GAMM|nr:beta-propeller fold lactonase family protein [Tahibacter harae]MCQ4165527.1 beta-propeller fold lactonase family protein [Tahibacter harae]
MSLPVRPRAQRALAAALLSVCASSACAAPFIYVANNLTDDISVFDAATRLLVATVPVGDQPFPVTITPDGGRALVGNRGSGTVSVIETAGNSVVATVTVGQGPYGIAVNPAGTRAYVANVDSNDVSVIDLADYSIVATIATPDASFVAVNPAGTRAYVSNGAANSISVIDTASNSVVNTIADVGISPWAIVFSPDGSRAYVTNFSGANVSVIDTASDNVLTRWPVGNSPVGIALNGDGSRLYTANSASDTVSIVDTTMGFPLNNLPVGHRPFGVAADPDGRMLYALNAGNFGNPGSISVFDGAANVVVATLPTAVFSGGVTNFVTPYTPPGTPTHISVMPGDRRVTLSFNPPFSDGGRPITGYTATCGAQSGNAPVPPVVVTGLTNGIAVTCQLYASNDRGNGTPSPPYLVTPAAVPGAPTITDVAAGNASVTVAFDTPASNGGAAITGYTANCGAGSRTGPASPLTVEGLPNGQAVQCSVYASNASGNGPASAPSAAVTPMTVPAAPVIAAAVRGDGTVSLYFDPPDAGGGDISGYHAYCQPGDLMLVGIQPPLVVEGLDDNSVYSCTVSAYNQVGIGAASAPVLVQPRPATDLAVSVSNEVDFIRGGSNIVYHIAVANQSTTGVTGARITDSTAADVGALQWTCAGSGGAQCPASGTGDIDFNADLPAGSSLLIALSVNVPALPESALTNTATVSVPPSWRDTDSSNDTASDGPDVRGIFRGGFD